ncbi:MAG: glycoside hydrolase family 3 N-terminal domain-containing protein [Arachnia sp.]
MDQHTDPTLPPHIRAELLLAQLSPEQKLAQVSCYLPADIADLGDFAERFPYGVGHVSCLEVRHATALDDVVSFQHQLQSATMAASGLGIPATFHMEGLCGAYLPGATSFPSGIARASAWDPELEHRIGAIVARQERAAGVTQTFAPVLDIARDPRMGRYGETYGEDPTLASSLGVAFTAGIQAETDGLRSDAVAKHFLGFHHSEGGIHGAHCDVPDRLLIEVYGKPFQAAISLAGLNGVMPCYGSIGGEPVSASRRLLTGLLREQMGFDGVVVSDYCAIGNLHAVQRVAETPAHAGLAAMTAGMDAELHFPLGFNQELLGWFADGTADPAILDQAVLRVLTAKFRMGLFEQPFAQGPAVGSTLSTASDREASLHAARESLVLLMNDGTLPLRAPRKIAVVGCHAVNPRFFFGGYTHLSMVEGALAARASMAGVKVGDDAGRDLGTTVPGTQVQSDESPLFDTVLAWQQPGIRSLVDELRARLPESEIVWAYGYPVTGADESRHDEALAAAQGADVVLLTLGGKHGTSSIATMGEGIDATDINLPPCQEKLIEKMAGLGAPLVGVHLDGRPVSSDAADTHLNALLEAWNPSEAGAQAIVDVLLGAHNPSGRLPVSVARSAGQTSLYYNHPNGSAWHQGESIGFPEYVDSPHTPRYPFGHGLGYTSFDYTALALSAERIPSDGTVEVAVTVTNTGERDGTEIVQLYVRDRYAALSRPVLELAGFQRVSLSPGASATVRFRLDASQLAFLDHQLDWLVEAGDIDVLVGASSEDIRLRGSFALDDSRVIDGRTRTFFAATRIEGEEQ